LTPKTVTELSAVTVFCLDVNVDKQRTIKIPDPCAGKVFTCHLPRKRGKEVRQGAQVCAVYVSVELGGTRGAILANYCGMPKGPSLTPDSSKTLDQSTLSHLCTHRHPPLGPVLCSNMQKWQAGRYRGNSAEPLLLPFLIARCCHKSPCVQPNFSARPSALCLQFNYVAKIIVPSSHSNPQWKVKRQGDKALLGLYAGQSAIVTIHPRGCSATYNAGTVDWRDVGDADCTTSIPTPHGNYALRSSVQGMQIWVRVCVRLRMCE
jgi:hypothetical protein